MFEFDLSNNLRKTLRILKRKDSKMFDRVYSKIEEIVSCGLDTVDHYKNLSNDMKDRKRVHIGHFVLIFKVFKRKNFILFTKFARHDDAYK